MKKTKLLFLSDSPLGKTGLGRVTKALADRTHDNISDVFDVGVAGVGLKTTRHSPYPIYPMDRNWGDFLPDIWKDFVGADEGILFSVMNAEYLRCLAFPKELIDCELRDFAQTAKMKKWIYAPIDAEGPNGVLPMKEIETLSKLDRILAYTEFGAVKINCGVFGGVPCVLDLPHGTDSAVFFPRSRRESRDLQFAKHILKKNGCLRVDLLIGCVATNTARKDWPLIFETCQELVCRGIDVGLWAHTDVLAGNWDLPTMAKEFGMAKRVQFTTGNLSDEDMAWGYAACDVTVGIGSGEGWGMPLSESLACGIPVVTGDYAGATQFVPAAYRVMPQAWRYDGFYCNRRPVFRAADWVDRILWARENPVTLQPIYTWDSCWPAWEKWLREGVER